MKINYSKEAIADLVWLREFIATHDPAAANHYAQRLIEGINRLQDQPMLGRAVIYAPDPESIRDLVIGNYIVRYALLSDQIMVLRVWHHRENRK